MLTICAANIVVFLVVGIWHGAAWKLSLIHIFVPGWKPKRCILVVDDIYTTGNTIHRTAEALKKAGVQKVYFLTISIGQGL